MNEVSILCRNMKTLQFVEKNIFRFSKHFKFQLCWSSHWLLVHKMGLLQQKSLYPNLRFWCKTYEWHHSWQEHTLKFWHRNCPHCIPHFSCKNNNSSGNQNSSKWFYHVLNPCTVLVYSLQARGKMHHCTNPVSCRFLQSPMSKCVFAQRPKHNMKRLWFLRHFLSQYSAFRISEAVCKSTAKMITPPNKS